jgi:hypothetical protein
VASIEHRRDGQSLVRESGDNKVLPEHRELGPVCHHCFTNRFRKNTFILQDADGKFISVGSSCLKDFLGFHRSPDSIATWMESLNALRGFTGGWGPGEPGFDPEFSLVDMLTVTAIDVDLRKAFFSQKMANEDDRIITTAYVVATALDLYRNDHLGDLVNPIRAILDDAEQVAPYVAQAEAAIEWAKNLSDEVVVEQSYLYNLRVIARGGYVTQRSLKLAVSIIPAHRRATTPAVEKAAVRPSEYVGKEGERTTLLVTVKVIRGVIGYSPRFGDMHKQMVIMEDPMGNKLVWFCTGENPLNEGDEVAVKATVKKHEEYRGEKQTTVSRLTLAKV